MRVTNIIVHIIKLTKMKEFLRKCKTIKWLRFLFFVKIVTKKGAIL